LGRVAHDTLIDRHTSAAERCINRLHDDRHEVVALVKRHQGAALKVPLASFVAPKPHPAPRRVRRFAASDHFPRLDQPVVSTALAVEPEQPAALGQVA